MSGRSGCDYTFRARSHLVQAQERAEFAEPHAHPMHEDSVSVNLASFFSQQGMPMRPEHAASGMEHWGAPITRVKARAAPAISTREVARARAHLIPNVKEAAREIL